MLDHVRGNEGDFRAMLESPARHPDRRRRARRGLLLGARAGPRPGDEGALHAERVRLAAARLPRAELLRRGLICRADDRGDPVVQLSPPLIAGPESSRRSRRSCGRRSRRRRARLRAALSGVLTAARARRATSTSGSSPARRGSTAPVRWVHISELADPTPWLSGGELLLTTGMQLGGAPRPARVRRAARRPRPGRPRLRHRLRARRGPRGAARGGRGARLPALRGAVRAAVHRDHREGVLAPGQRAVRACCGARSRRTSGSSGSCSPSAASTACRRAGLADRRPGADLRRARRAARARPRRRALRDDALAALGGRAARARAAAARARGFVPAGALAGRALALPGRAAPRRADGDGAVPQAWLVAAKDARRRWPSSTG